MDARKWVVFLVMAGGLLAVTWLFVCETGYLPAPVFSCTGFP